MEWFLRVNDTIRYIEDNLTEEIDVRDAALHAHCSLAHFGRMFALITGLTVGEYLRNRRLSLAGQELSTSGCKVSDVALKYRYDTPESFSKAFARFHGVPPSEAIQKKSALKVFYPLHIHLSIQGGFGMSGHFIDEFFWNDMEKQEYEKLDACGKYQRFVLWAGKARAQNPNVFDSLTEWILDDAEWKSERLAENEQILLQGVFARFLDQNARMRRYLRELEPSGVVNQTVFAALERFDRELSGDTNSGDLRPAVFSMFHDFSSMESHDLRKRIAGGKTGPTGTDSVQTYGFINLLKDCDAGVQWALFMPELVRQQQNGFSIDRFECRKMPAMRFIGRECREGDEEDGSLEGAVMRKLDRLEGYRSGFDYDLLFLHHFGRGVDQEPCHRYWGRFMRENTPVPEGLVAFDFLPERATDGVQAGPPYLSQFVFAVFFGDEEAMHRLEGYDCDAMYDVTRNMMLGSGITIPYPDQYWTAEVFRDGCGKPSDAYLFSAEF